MLACQILLLVSFGLHTLVAIYNATTHNRGDAAFGWTLFAVVARTVAFGLLYGAGALSRIVGAP